MLETISFIITLHDEILSAEKLLTWCLRGEKVTSNSRRNKSVNFEIIIITDNAENKSINGLQSVQKSLPLTLIIEREKMNKAHLIKKGFSYASNHIIILLTHELLLPFPALEPLLKKIQGGTDVIIATQPESGIEAAANAVHWQSITDPFQFHVQHTHGQDIVICTKYVWDTIQFSTFSERSFLLEFVHRALEAGFITNQYTISLLQTKKQRQRKSAIPVSCIQWIQILLVRLKTIPPLYLSPINRHSMIDAGFGYKKKKFITHTSLKHKQSAIESIGLNQKLLGIILLEITFFCVLINLRGFLQTVIGFLSIIYFIDIFFNFYLVLKTLRVKHELEFTPTELQSLTDEILPVYSILCPLYKEAHMIEGFLKGIENIQYPQHKLDVILLLEEDDTQSLTTVKQMPLPSYVRVLIVPDSQPKTKPKACNFGLYHARGEYIVIYDAEDIPDPLQLKKALLGFHKSSPSVVCMQAKLNYYNPNQNLLTRFFTAEYSLWFDITLTGLQSLNTIIPLGGTSNHFRVNQLKRLSAWDPFNVTEDADLGMRLFKDGYQTAIIDSVTLEEANSNVGNWLRQRSRWIKGYMQTYLVHTRGFIPFLRKRGMHAIIFQLVIGGKIAFIFINPIMWFITLSYFLFYSLLGPGIESVYTPAILYIAIISLLFGNYLYLFCYILGCVKNKQWGLIKYVPLIPLYWILMSIAGCLGLYQLLWKPHYWEKTIHGLNKTTPGPEKNTHLQPVSNLAPLLFPRKSFWDYSLKIGSRGFFLL